MEFGFVDSGQPTDFKLIDIEKLEYCIKITDEAQLATAKCFFNGAVRCRPKFISSFNVLCRGQNAASEAHH